MLRGPRGLAGLGMLLATLAWAVLAFAGRVGTGSLVLLSPSAVAPAVGIGLAAASRRLSRTFAGLLAQDGLVIGAASFLCLAVATAAVGPSLAG